ncbi:procathepsin L [Nematolebias whitei]|uniref:procathepsin L n=1 Tax=Nematolebias whitei TaxID=451745 RepID=UPI0018973AE9|nr:procathepsin L [Nematolebias whitei]
MMLLVVVVTVCLSAVLSAPSLDPQLDQDWDLWKSWHNKTYKEREEVWRRTVWEKNLKKIQLHNLEHSMGKHSYLLGMNRFGDMTNEEFTHIMNGFKPKANKKTKASLFTKPTSMKVPSSVDWRTEGYVTPVKDQGQCGSCWAFSATGSMEGQQFRKAGTLVSLSEQNLVDCSGSTGNQGCNGGWMDRAFEYVMNNGGLDSELSYPYVAMDELCRYSSLFSAIKVAGYADIAEGSEEGLMEAVGTVGPVSVAIDASKSSFQFYSSGIYYEPECSTLSLDHGVLVVGYGSNGNENYWIVKNSWGELWGNKGYIQMSRNRDNNCAISSYASYPKV